ncbi:MAG TPA: type II secretion system protein [Tepidisphaeraceae bacterium]|nr:type II secretion system protein [Tepidisphaeraceae bacterium]
MFPSKFRVRRAFTLVEILTVVVILGIASAVIIPQIGSRSDLVCSAGARVVMADLIYAQNRAIAMQRKHFVQFSGQTYTLRSRDSDTSAMTDLTHPITKGTYSTTFNSSGSGLSNVTLTSASFGGKAYMGFDELGQPFSFDSTTGPNGTITALTNNGTIVITSGTASLTISVEPFTGEITVQ